MPARGLDAGDLFWAEFGMTLGHEQSGRRPGLVLTSRAYNERSSFVILCPITRNDRAWPFKIAIPTVGGVRGFAFLDQMRSLDAAERVFGHIGRLPSDVWQSVQIKLAELFNLREILR